MTGLRRYFIIVIFFALYVTHSVADGKKYDEITSKAILKKGFFDFYWNNDEGKVYLKISEWKKEFLYITFLAAGVGSNDIGLDRGQIGGTKVTRFERYGPKVLLIQSNYNFRAESKNPDEQKSVDEAFAESVLAGFKVQGEKNGSVLIDISDFIVSDAHNVTGTLKRSGQGSYNLDKNRSVIYHENTKNFPFNSEFEAMLTFSGKPTGSYTRRVVPSPESITVRQRHSFVSLPDENYKKRVFDPRAGYFGINYMDYATPIDQDIHKRYISRHRLQKKYPRRKMSEAVEPIIYYMDRGAPEPIRSALIEGASWWNEAFDAAGFKNAFQVTLLPEGIDPLDVRYNVIQWVHRSTRGWSYGGTIRDPRTGEIIKGHVSLGSLRVRQDYLIAQGLLTPFEEGETVSDDMKDMALARLRQLSAHEVGHTLGLAHNYIASSYDRGSVMDYPHPYIKIGDNGEIDLSDAYGVGIGEWDKVTIRFGYSAFSEKQHEKEELNKILQDGIERGIVFLSDQDARPAGSAHPKAHLWDNGKDAADELSRIMEIRRKALDNFSEKNIPIGAPMASLEEVLVPVYFLHRYQLEAAAKVIGGLEYNYAVRGDGTFTTRMVDINIQKKALHAVLETIHPQQLALDESIIKLIPPKPLGYGRDRENINTHTGLTFDPLAAAEISAKMTLSFLLNPQKCARLVELNARAQEQLSLNDLLDEVYDFIFSVETNNKLEEEIRFIVSNIFIDELIQLARNESASLSVKAVSRNYLIGKIRQFERDEKGLYLMAKIQKFIEEPALIQSSKSLKPPDGSPIGSGEEIYHFKKVQCANIH